MIRACESCGSRFEQTGRGRPRRWCFECSPRVADVGRAVVSQLYREREDRAYAKFLARKKRIAYPIRICGRCEARPTVTNRNWYCSECRVEALNERISRRYRRNMTSEELAKAREREQRRRRLERPWNSLRYDAAHRRARAEVEGLVASGGVRCARGAWCNHAVEVNGRTVGGIIHPGEPWDLGHPDLQSVGGPEHAACNRATARRERRLRVSA